MDLNNIKKDISSENLGERIKAINFLIKNDIEDKIRKTYKDIIILDLDQTIKNGALKKYHENSEELDRIDEIELPKLKKDLSAEIKKSTSAVLLFAQ